LIKWLTNYFHGSSAETHAIIFGPSGVGKTFLAQALANDFQVPLIDVSCFEITDKKSINDFKKILNVQCIGYDYKEKLILVDDLLSFTKYCQGQLTEKIIKLSKNPIIFTINGKHELRKLPNSFKKAGIIVELKKPTHTELISLLKQEAKRYSIDISDDLILDIAKKSMSVRAAINSLFTSDINELVLPDYSVFEKLNQIKNKKLKVNINKFLLKTFAISTYDYKTIHFLKAMNEKTNIMFNEEIDKFMFNHYPFLKLPDYNDLRFQGFVPNKPKNEEFCKRLHVSQRVLDNEYKFITKTDDKKIKIEKQTRKGEPNTKDLHDYFEV
jgi:DNA polymerase III delta prime subunit